MSTHDSTPNPTALDELFNDLTFDEISVLDAFIEHQEDEECDDASANGDLARTNYANI